MFTPFSDCSVSSYGGDFCNITQTITTAELVGKMIGIHRLYWMKCLTFKTCWEFVFTSLNTGNTVCIQIPYEPFF